MRRNYLGIGLMTFASLFLAASCSDDEEAYNGNEVSNPDATAYITVTLNMADDETRGSATDPEFEVGTTDERAISNIYFLFYDANGKFVTKSNPISVPNTTTPTGNEGTATADEVEFTGTCIVKVDDYNPSNIPTNLVTVVNAPSGYTFPSTLDAFVSESSTTGSSEISTSTANKAKIIPVSAYMKDGGNYFIMSTSSYKRSATDKNYFVTKLSAKNFFANEDKASHAMTSDKGRDSIVDVYVERLAAKVNVSVSDDLTAISQVDQADNISYNTYNIGNDSTFTINTFENGEVGTRSTKFYARFLSWGINCQPSLSYLMKRIDYAGWTSDYSSLYFNWEGTHRSYWAKSYNYGKHALKPATGVDQTYQYYYWTRYQADYDNKTRAAQDEDNSINLVYLNENQLTTAIGASGYCPENTNTSDILQNIENYQSAVTCALIKARLVDADGKPLQVIKYGEHWYTEDAFKNLVLSNFTLYTDASQGEKLDISKLQIVSNTTKYNGAIHVALKSGVTAYDESGSVVDADEQFKLLTTDVEAIAYGIGQTSNGTSLGGDMYYSIPIQHLRPGAPTTAEINADETKSVIKEGHFGVVRNHIYKLTVESIMNPGHGIFDPDEPIIPPVEKDANYYIGVRLNILSWKAVSQSVTL